MPIKQGQSSYKCQLCCKKFTRSDNLKRHEAGCGRIQDMFKCADCGYTTTRYDNLQQHMFVKHLEPAPAKRMKMTCMTEPGWVKAMKGYHKCLRIPGNADYTFESWLSKNGKNIIDAIDSARRADRAVKMQLIVEVCFREAIKPDRICAYFSTKQAIVLQSTQLEKVIASARTQIDRKIDEFIKMGSGWIVQEINHVDLHIATYRPISGSTYIPLPAVIANKKAVINIQNNDNKCFLWSVLAAKFPAQRDAQRVTNYAKHESTLNLTDIEFPMTLSSIAKFEKANDLRINVYGYETELEVLHISSQKHEHAIHLLLITSGDKQHYCLIRDLGRLLRSQRKSKVQKYFCERCLVNFTTDELRNQHLVHCTSDNQRVKMTADTHCEFKNTQKMLRRPYVIYADFECLTEQISSCQQSSEKSHTHKYQVHTPCSYGMLGVVNCGHKQEIQALEVHRGADATKHFLNSILRRSQDYQDLLCSPQEALNSAEGQICYICNEPVDKGVTEHCHICGIVRGIAHSKCNLALKLDRDVIVAMHNLRRYDGHIIMQELGSLCAENGLTLECLPKGLEDYLSFAIVMHGKQKYRIRFIDTLQFLPSSLEQLAKNVKELAITSSVYEGRSLELVRRKGVYCYDYMNTWEKFEDKELPSVEKFKSSLTGKIISEEDYDHAKEVWNHFKCKNLGDYSDLYLRTDVLLLADVFESFRAFALETYRLDPCHYFTLPSFAWDCCLLYTKVKLELLSDVDMYTFFEAGIRGGVSMITKRHAKANNKYVADYDPSKESTFITYLDMNNLYGKSMIDKLPIGEFEWVSEIPGSEANDYGYVAEVDLEYPETLHNEHNDYPLAPERLEISQVSEYSKALQQVQKSVKLVPNLFNKEKYIVHYRNLDYYVKKGMQITKIHRILKFKESAWMKPYTEFNTAMRAQALSEFEKDLFKLMNNAVFGKTMENVRKYVNVRLVTDEQLYLKLVSKPNYIECRRFTEDLVAVKSKRPSTTLNKPVYVGFTVLELSKLYMYEFHMDEMKARYKDRAKLLFTDTDSLAYEIQTEDWYEDMAGMLELLDTSNYPSEHKLYSSKNKKVIGKMKDECPNNPIIEFVGLRAKMYSIKTTESEKKTAKGVTRATKNELSHADYLEALLTGKARKDKMKMIRNKGHELYAIEVNKTTLSPYDDKRYILEDGIQTLAHGHYNIS